MAKRLFIYDLRDKDIRTEKALNACLNKLEDFPGIAKIGIYVTNKQKVDILQKGSGNSTRYIPADDEPFCSDRDLLCYDAPNLAVVIISESDIKHFGVRDQFLHENRPCWHPEWEIVKEKGKMFGQQCKTCKKIELIT